MRLRPHVGDNLFAGVVAVGIFVLVIGFLILAWAGVVGGKWK